MLYPVLLYLWLYDVIVHDLVILLRLITCLTRLNEDESLKDEEDGVVEMDFMVHHVFFLESDAL